MNIGFLGGSFDPVHFGHLLAAQDAFEQHRLDRLFFVPAAQAPLKPGRAHASGEDRLSMLRAAVEGDARFEISDYELRKGGVSYTVDSARHFRSVHPGDRLYWIIGGDQLPLLGRWREIAELAGLVEFIVLERPGHAAQAPPDVPGLRLHRCAGRLLGVSSTEIRARARLGAPLDYFTPHKTVVYIKERGLYRDST